MAARIVDVRHDILKKNDLLAHDLRARFAKSGVFVVSLVSSPGSGKTALLEETLRRLQGTHRVAALVGDLATENDAVRLARSGAPVRQIVTGTVCHLDAEMVARSIDGLATDGIDVDRLDVLFIENVGNLVCPASYDIGEDVRVVLMSVTEGEDKPLKYPTIFNTADVAIITKVEMAELARFDSAAAHRSIASVRPGIDVLEVSTFTGAGFDTWMTFLAGGLAKKRASGS